MAPREPYQPSSLKSHIASVKNTGSSGGIRSSQRPAATVKKETVDNLNNIFGNNDDDDDDDDANTSDSDSDADSDRNKFMTKLTSQKTANGSSSTRRRSKDDEIADSDVERQHPNKKQKAVNGRQVHIKKERESSDDDLEPEPAEPKVKTNGKAPVKREPESSTSSSGSDDDSDDSSSSSDDEEGPIEKAAANDNEPPKAVESDEDTSSEASSSSEDEAGPVSKAKPAAKAAKGASSTTSPTSSDDSSESEEEPEPEPKPKKTAAKPAAKKPAAKVNGAKAKTPSSSSSSSGSDSDSDSDADSESEDEAADVSMHISDREEDKQVSAVPKQIAPDFMLRKSEEGLNGEDVVKICNQASLEGKQLWYFTVPSHLPVSVVQNLEIPMDAAQQGNRIFSHNGEDYGISCDTMTPKSTIQILIPSADGSQYHSSPRQLDQVMQIKRITQLGASSSTSGPAAQPAARPQPEGLRNRFKPIGVYDPVTQVPALKDRDTEMTEAPVEKLSKKEKKKAEKAKEAEKAQEAEKLKQAEQEKAEKAKEKKEKKEKKAKKPKKSVEEEDEIPATQESTLVTGLKRKHTPSEDEAALASSQLLQENQTAETKSKKRKTTDRTSGSPDLGSEPTRKETPVLPPQIPSSSLPAASTPTPAAKKSKSKKKEKEVATPAPASSQLTQPLSTAKKNTPVPLPNIPGSSQHKGSPAPTSSAKDKPKKTKGEKASKGKGKD